MNAHDVTPDTYVPQDKLHVWILVDPSNPTLVGELKLSKLVSDCAIFTYTTAWRNFNLSQ